MAVEAQELNTYRGRLLGREVEFEYSQRWIATALLGLRLVMGWTFLQAGLEKLFAPEPWTAAGFLQFAIPEGNPFVGLWAGMAGSPLIDGLVVWGQILIGLALILGIAVRWSAFWGAVMMILFWMASLMGGLGQFLPLEHGWVVDDHLVYAVLLFAMGAFGAGRIVGFDAAIEKMDFVKNNEWVKLLLG